MRLKRSHAIVAAVLLLPRTAAGQDPERDRVQRRAGPLHATRPLAAARTSTSPPDPELDAIAEAIATALAQEYVAASHNAAAPPADCRRPEAVAEHQLALRSFARYPECVEWTRTCERQQPAGAPGLERVLSSGARCATAMNDIALAHEWHERATRPEYATSPVYAGLVFFFARFADVFDYKNEVDAILSRNPAWAGSMLPLVRAALEFLLDDAPSTPAVDSLVAEWMDSPDAVLRQVTVIDHGWTLAVDLPRTRDAARLFAAKAQSLTSPEAWWSPAYTAVYSSVRDGNFVPARRIYEAVVPYLHLLSPLPIENNPYTYTELYGFVCPAQLTAGAGYTRYRVLERDWLEGRISVSDAYAQGAALSAAEGPRADILTLLGGIAEDLGRDSQAQDLYWRAHLACPYYNRAHRGLFNVRLRRSLQARKDHDAVVARADAAIRATPFTPDVRHFVANWSALTDERRKRVLYGLRLWAPYIDFLLDGDAHIYFTRAPELTSEIGPLASVRDARFFDNRLLDDIGGMASQSEGTAIADLASATQAPLVDYDAAAHEVAHLFHFLLPNAQKACLTLLYERARARQGFPFAYASRNDHEYFAVGVEYYVASPDAGPAIFGWLRRNDPDLASFSTRSRKGGRRRR